MKTLQEDVDDLDRMVDTGAQRDAIRSQIRLISREIAALQADYSSLGEAHEALKIAHAKLQDEHAKLTNAQTEKPPEIGIRCVGGGPFGMEG